MDIQNQHRDTGSTLIETVIYFALLAVIMGAVSVAAFSIVEAGGRNQTHIYLQEEGEFLLAKLDWALSGASNMSVISTSSLEIVKYNFPSNPLRFEVIGGVMRLQAGTAGQQLLHSDRVSVTGMVFEHIPATDGKPEGVQVSFELNSFTPQGKRVQENFEMTKYVRR